MRHMAHSGLLHAHKQHSRCTALRSRPAAHLPFLSTLACPLPANCAAFVLAAVLSGNIEVLHFLIQRSTWPDAADGADDTALHLAARCARKCDATLHV
jgi:hypothetical protein